MKCQHGENTVDIARDSQYVNVEGSLRFEEPVMSQPTRFATKLCLESEAAAQSSNCNCDGTSVAHMC